MIDAKTFFDGWRQAFGRLTQGQVGGINSLLAEMEGRGWSDPRWWAYALATVHHETGFSMQPVEEWGRGRGKAYGEPDPETGQTYYGRGHVQLTWRKNYEVLGKALGLDLVHKPDLALEPTHSAAILAEGMERGLFTGKRLGDYFNATANDPFNARRIVNGTDRAQHIADTYAKILPIVERAMRKETDDELNQLRARVAKLEKWAAAVSKYLQEKAHG